MSADPFHLNRPVHLARRDAFYEQAELLITQLSSQKKLTDQKAIADQALHFFNEARRHAVTANQAPNVPEHDLLFAEFLDIAVDNTQSITRMLRRQQAAETENCKLERFLDTSDTGSKMSTHYRRCAAHILKGLLYVLQQAAPRYVDLQQTTLSKLTETDRRRYEKARTCFAKKEELKN